MNLVKTALIAMVLVGCANPGSTYGNEDRNLAEQGRLPWSTYYEQKYARYSDSTTPGRGALLGRINEMILAAKAYEKGEISKDQFAYLQRKQESAQLADDESIQRAHNEIVLRGLTENTRILNSMMPAPVPPPAPVLMKGPTVKNIDSACLMRCTSAGYSYGLCESKCSY